MNKTGYTASRVHKYLYQLLKRCRYGWMDEHIDGRKDERTDDQMFYMAPKTFLIKPATLPTVPIVPVSIGYRMVDDLRHACPKQDGLHHRHRRRHPRHFCPRFDQLCCWQRWSRQPPPWRRRRLLLRRPELVTQRRQRRRRGADPRRIPIRSPLTDRRALSMNGRRKGRKRRRKGKVE